jgi:hypothetical protein
MRSWLSRQSHSYASPLAPRIDLVPRYRPYIFTYRLGVDALLQFDGVYYRPARRFVSMGFGEMNTTGQREVPREVLAMIDVRNLSGQWELYEEKVEEHPNSPWRVDAIYILHQVS